MHPVFGIVALMGLGATGLLYWFAVVRPQKFKRAWEAGVVDPLSAKGMHSTPSKGLYNFASLRSDASAPPAIAMVFNGVPLEQELARTFSFLNTNDWMTLITAELPTREKRGPRYVRQRDNKVALIGERISMSGDASAVPLYGEDAEAVHKAWTDRAQVLYASAGEDFWVISGGRVVTIAKKGVCEDAKQVEQLMQLAAELAQQA